MKYPLTMKAYVVTAPGQDYHQLQACQLACPVPASGQLLIRTLMVSLNPVDYKLLTQHPVFWSYPYIPGLDIVGEVVGLGEGCQRFSVGERVALHANLRFGGGLAEYSVQPEHAVFAVPSSVTSALAAALPCAGLTAFQALVRKMRITSGRTILIQGGSGGVGSFAIIIAKACGLQVVTTCSAAKREYVASLGADLIIAYDQEDIYPRLSELYPAGLDYILETISRDNLVRDVQLLAFNGQLASIVGMLPTANLPEFRYGLSFHEVALGGAYLAEHYPSQIDLSIMGAELFQLLSQAGKSPQITVYPAEQLKQAFNDLQTNASTGKIVVDLHGRS